MGKRKKIVLVVITTVVAVSMLMMSITPVASGRIPVFEDEWYTEDVSGTNHGTATIAIAIVIVGIVISVLLLIILKRQSDIKKALLEKKKDKK